MFAAATKNSTPSRNPSLFNSGSSTTFIQPKLDVGKPGDKYEVEADKAADQIVAKSNDTTTPFFPPAPSIQKNAEEEVQKQETQETDIQQQPVVDTIIPGVQLKETTPIQKTKEEEIQTMTDTEQIQESSIENTTQSKEMSQEITPPLPIVQQMSSEDLQKKEEEEVQEKEEEEVQTLQKQTSGEDSTVSPSVENTLQSTKGGGSPLDNDTRNEMESGFGADFSGVRVHNDSTAVQMNQQLGAQAFTNGSDIYFNEGNYNPGSDSGKHLLAHELTHTVQQGAADVQRKPLQISSAPIMIQGFAISDLPSLAVDEIRDIARRIPGYTLFTVIIEYNPITSQRVERTAINLVQGLLELIPVAGPAIFDKLQEYGILERAFDWVRGQLSELGLTSTALLDLIGEAWNELEFPYTNALDILTRKFDTLLNRVIRFVSSLTEQLLTWIKEALIDVAEPYLEENQAWSLLKKVIHYDPLRDEEVSAETVEILEDFLMLIGKETELEQMRERGTLQETADWLDTQMGAFSSLLGQLTSLIDAAWDAIQPENLPNILDSLSSLATQAGEFLEGLWEFASTIAIEVLKLIKDALLGWLSTVAAEIPGFTLLTVIIQRNPLTGEVVQRSIQNIIRGFMGLVPGGEAKYQELRESGVIPRAAGQIEALIAQLGMSAETIIQLFTDLWNSFTIDDLVDPLPAFERITAQFGEPIIKLFTFIVKVVKVLIELILEIMGIPPDMIANIIANAMSAFEDIKNDPVAFLMHLMDALKNGFIQFLNNIGTHLLSGLQNWLFGTLADAGVEIPSDLSIRSLLGMAMDVLGITLDNILERLAIRIGPERVAQIRTVLDTLTGVWAFVRDVIERGPIAIWEYIQDQISNLWNVIKEGIMGFIQERVIQQAMGWLLSFLDVTGIMPVIRGVQTAFNAISSFIEKLREILEIVNSFVAGIADIARGNIQSAANFLETALADGIPVAISFLAKQLGLGDISEKIAEMIENTRAMINEGIDWLIDRALAAGTAFLNALGLGGGDETEAEPEEAEERNSGEFTGIDEEIDTASGEDHTLYIRENSNGGYDIIIESTPTVFEDFIMLHFNRIEDPDDDMVAAKDAALAKAREVDRIVTSITADEEVSEEDRTQVDQKLDELGRVTISFMDAAPVSDIPEHNITWGSRIGSFGSSMSITYLKSKTTGAESSNLPFQENQILMQRKNTGGQKYYRNGHLLNANLHGPDDWKNLTPLSSSGNSRHLHQIEAPLKEALPSEGNPEFKAFRYVVTVSYTRGINTSLIAQVEASENEYVEANRDTIIEIIRAERYVPISLRAQSVELEDVNGSWVEKSSGRYNISTPDIPNPIGDRPEDYRVTNERVLSYPVSYRNASREDFLIAGLTEPTVNALLTVRENPRLSITDHDTLHSELLKVISGSGGRVRKQTLIDRINL
ncbi:hypothetical protein GCM10011344_25110 [Dokdonia pacifica]|uniref:Phage-related protein n=1 Tax=Dokdonia pacifica TaxID=1627892 RepID=A0A238WR40_9FLAO|nr:DUF4157 domain-containing protein [Dokdonia pacifica]GGG23349.1 hypothetical protein GCM10011344_25110 [Dokdonia pacifica]SNR48861.1 Phage-related protein [Dokdonia pacifica]